METLVRRALPWFKTSPRCRGKRWVWISLFVVCCTCFVCLWPSSSRPPLYPVTGALMSRWDPVTGFQEQNSSELKQEFGMLPKVEDEADYVDTAKMTVNLTMQRLIQLINKRISRAGNHLAHVNATDSRSNSTLFLTTVMPDGGLGNFMSFSHQYWAEERFMHLGIHHVNTSEWTRFADQTEAEFEATFHGYGILEEQHAMIYDDRMSKLNAEFENQHVAVDGYLQSWRYFDQYRDDIRALFTFSELVYLQAQEKLRARLNEHVTNLTRGTSGVLFELPVLVGIHVRRGDVVDPGQHKHGHQPASNEYLLRMPLKLQTKYENVWFLVFTNDMEYCRNLYDGLENFVFMTSLEIREPAVVDMAILSLMDSLILTVGTFGWWAAYLSDATDVYYFKDWPRKGSTMKNTSIAEDYFLPGWKPFL